MKRIILLSILLFHFLSGFSHSLSAYSDSSRDRAKNNSTIRLKPTTNWSRNLVKTEDTSLDPLIATNIDSALVMDKDFPMPVNESSYFENDLYKKRLDTLSKQIPLNYNEFVQSYINLYLYKRRPLIERLLGEGQYYFPLFEKALCQSGVPAELKYLPIIESALNPFAVSRVGATGPWQFMYGTGKDYGLQINAELDERRDPYKSSLAAAHYFKDMYARYGDWLLVIASYNCGKGNVDKAVRKAGGVKNFWAIQRYLPRETRTYVPAFIAASYAMNFYKEHGLHMVPAQWSMHPDSIKLDQTVSLLALAEKLCISTEEIKRLNPQFRKPIVKASPENQVGVLVPEGNAERIPLLVNEMKSNPDEYLKVNSEYNGEAGGGSIFLRLIHYRVHRGETLSAIAGKYSCNVADIKTWNHLHSNQLELGQNLKLKLGANVNSNVHLHTRIKVIHYRVRRGDTLESIAMHYNIPVSHIKGLNRLHSNLVRTGQSLKLGNSI